MKNNVPKSLKLKLSIKKNVVNNFVFFLNLKKVKNYSDTKKKVHEYHIETRQI